MIGVHTCNTSQNVNDHLQFYIDQYNPTHMTPMNSWANNSLIIANAGGNSEISEAWSINHIMAKLKASECLAEMEIKYWCDYKMVDYIIGIPIDDNQMTRIGVSVTRAMCNPYRKYTRNDAITLLEKKLNGLIISRNTVIDEQSFFQSILHIWVPDINVANLLIDVIASGDVDIEHLQITGTLDIWITASEYQPIFNNGVKAIFF